MTRMPCGCLVPDKTARNLAWLRRKGFLGLFDLIHNERFVRFYMRKERGLTCVS